MSQPTVVVTGANCRTGRDLLPRLARQDMRVVALVRTPQDLPVDEVVADWTRAPRAVEVLAEASVVIHLTGVFAAADWDSYEVGNVATTRRVVEAINPAARLVYLSYVGADPAHDNWYIRSKGQAEELVRMVADHVIFRIDAIAGGHGAPAPFELMYRQTGLDAPVRVIGDGTQRFRPILATDVADAITNGARGVGEAGTYDLVGPSELAITDIVDMVNGHAVPIERIPVNAATAVPWPPVTVVELLANPPLLSTPDAVSRAFELTLTRPEAAWPVVQRQRS